MGNLYRRGETGDSIEYIKINGMFYYGDPLDGIWYVKRTKRGRNFNWLNKRLEDLPESIERAKLEPYKPEIARRLMHRLYESYEDSDVFVPITAKEIIDIVFDTIAKGVVDE